MPTHRLSSTSILSLLLLVLALQSAPAAQAIRMQLDLDGTSIAGFTRTYEGDTPKEFWSLLKHVPLTFNRNYTLPLETPDATEITLNGTITLQQTRLGEVQAQADLTRLKLVKRADKWYVPDAEVDRTLDVAGLNFDLQNLSTDGFGKTLQYVAIGMAAFVLLLLLLAAMGKKNAI